jgi:DNA-3-methyladenine glycosylase II
MAADSAAMAAAAEHLRAVGGPMAELVRELGALEPTGPGLNGRPAEHYGALVRAITGQQLSVKAASAIYGRLQERFGGRPPTPDELLTADPDDLRAVGMSGAKVRSLRSLAEHVLDGRLELEALDALPDETVHQELTAVTGIGPWTADMFLLFHLGRQDVLPVGDLGVRRGAERLFGLPDLPSAEELTGLAEPWRPWRSVASRYLWALLANAPD